MATTSTKYYANTGVVSISTANTGLGGTGALGLIITGALASGTNVGGTLVKRVFIKATNTTARGVVRLFKYDGVNYFLLREVQVSAVVPSAIFASYAAAVTLNIVLKSGESLYASTQVANSFNVVAEGIDFGSCDCNDGNGAGQTIKYDSNNGSVLVDTGNSSLTGSGSLGTVLTAASSASSNIGTVISTVIVKGAQSSTSQGMIRLFLNDGVAGTNYLFHEIPVFPVATNGLMTTLSIPVPLNLTLETGFILKASTENTENFNVIGNAMQFICCDCAE